MSPYLVFLCKSCTAGLGGTRGSKTVRESRGEVLRMSAFSTKVAGHVSQEYIRLGLLQNCDLTSMVEVVLDHAVQHEIDRIVLHGDNVLQPSIVYESNSLTERNVASFESVQCRPPRLLARVTNWRPIHLRRRILKILSLESSEAYAFPCGDMKDYFPDA